MLYSTNISRSLFCSCKLLFKLSLLVILSWFISIYPNCSLDVFDNSQKNQDVLVLISNIKVQIMVCQKTSFFLRALISCTKWIHRSSLHGNFLALQDTTSVITDVILRELLTNCKPNTLI